MTCGGFDTSFFGGCSMAWLIFGLLLFLVLILRKQITDTLGMDYNQWGGLVCALLPYIIVVSITGNYKWGLGIGLIGALVGGFGAAAMFGGSEGGSEWD